MFSIKGKYPLINKQSQNRMLKLFKKLFATKRKGPQNYT